MISDAEDEDKLRDRLFHGVLKALRDSIQYLYGNPAVTYTQVLVAARKAEAEVSDSMTETMTIKAKAATANEELLILKQQVSDLVAVAKACNVWESPKRVTQKNDQRNGNKSRRAQTFGTNGHFNTMGPLKSNPLTQPIGAQSAQQCYHCWGWGHMTKECVTPLNY